MGQRTRLHRVQCPVCGRVVAGYVPRGGDGTYYRPRRHGDCEGRFWEGRLVDERGNSPESPDSSKAEARRE